MNNIDNCKRDLKYWIEKKCEVCGNLFWSLIKRNGRYCSNACSSKVTSNDINRINKIKSTKLKRYGDAGFVNPEKAKATNLKKYGVSNVSKSPEIIEKIKSANFKRYGVDWSWQADEVKDKIRNTIFTKYGVENVSKSPVIREKIKSILFERYGVDNIRKASVIIAKIKETNLKLYGNEIPMKNKTILNKVLKSSRETYYNKIKDRLSDRVELLFDKSLYISTDKSNLYKFKCKKCNVEFEDHMDGGRIPRCMTCYPYLNGVSTGELEILNYIKSILPDGTIIEDKCWKVLGNKELDIYIPSLKIAIEYDGLYWHGEIGGNKHKRYHIDKTDKCNELGIRLIHIFEDEWTNKNEIVKSKLRHILQVDNSNVEYARKCEVVELVPERVENFLTSYHIQSSCRGSIKIGLLNKQKEIVAVMLFGSPRISMGVKKSNIGEYELLRYATSCNVIGGASKMLSYFLKNYNPTKITSYADLRWSNSGNNSLYNKLGFDFINNTDPNYWYFLPGYNIRYYRFNFRKSELSKKLSTFNPLLTEWENMQLNGYDRIWDCGNAKYEWIKK